MNQTWSHDDVKNEVFKLVHKLHGRLVQDVAGFVPMDRDDLTHYIDMFTDMLEKGTCDCGATEPQKQNCRGRHDLRRLPEAKTSGRDGKDPRTLTLPEFLRRAIFGPRPLPEKGLAGKAVMEGMFLRYLQQEVPLALGEVAFNTCPHCLDDKGGPYSYEGGICNKCEISFNNTDSPILARDWLFLQGVYTHMLYFKCLSDDVVHYYRPHHCLPIEQQPTDKEGDPKVDDRGDPVITYRVECGQDADGKERHDHCPWKDCPSGPPPPKHRQRVTQLWTRQFGNPLSEVKDTIAPPELPLLRAALICALQQTAGIDLPTLNSMSRTQLCELYLELLSGRGKERAVKMDALLAALEECGIDKETLLTFLNHGPIAQGRTQETRE